MAEKNEMNNKQAAAFLDALAEVGIKETKKNGVFIVPGLGRLVKSNRKARMGRNPQTGEAIKNPLKTVGKVPRGQGREGLDRTRKSRAFRS